MNLNFFVIGINSAINKQSNFNAIAIQRADEEIVNVAVIVFQQLIKHLVHWTKLDSSDTLKYDCLN